MINDRIVKYVNKEILDVFELNNSNQGSAAHGPSVDPAAYSLSGNPLKKWSSIDSRPLRKCEKTRHFSIFLYHIFINLFLSFQDLLCTLFSFMINKSVGHVLETFSQTLSEQKTENCAKFPEKLLP